MSETVQIVLGILFLISVFILTRLGIAWKLRKTAGFILKELESQGAVDVFTAVDLPYSKPDLLRIGMRDYHHKALGYLIDAGAVIKTGTGKYYVRVGSAVD
ncbi:hypothetical protein ACFL2Q_18295 [Thermodesulfobacteriota bacterium]